MGTLRSKLRRKAPGKGTADISKRMAWMSRVCDEWSTEEFNNMDEEDMDELVKGYEDNIVRSFESIRLGNTDQDVVWHFDASFGWM